MLTLLTNVQAWMSTRLDDRERGATAVEYGLLVGLIAVAIVATLALLGPELNRLFTSVLTALQGAGN